MLSFVEKDIGDVKGCSDALQRMATRERLVVHLKLSNVFSQNTTMGVSFHLPPDWHRSLQNQIIKH